MKQLARLGLGVAVMAPWVARKELAAGSLVAHATPRSKIARQWVVIHQGGREIRPAEQTFIGLCRMATTDLTGG
jgi:DNA-binding transcriptional LysR family regulator